MRNIFVVIIVLSLSSCYQMTEMIMEEIFIEYPIIERPLNEAWQETAKFIYVKEPKGQNEWKSPIELKKDGWGDCEDFSSYLIYQLGPKSELVGIIRAGTEDSRDNIHAIVYFEGKYLEPQKYNKYYIKNNFELVWTMSYDAVMKRSTAMYTK